MRTSYLAVALAVSAVVAGVNSAMAGGRGLGGSGPSSTPPGFASSGGHNGFENFTHSTTTTSSTGVSTATTSSEYLPGGWDEGKASWKAGLQSANPDLPTRPPGLAGR